MLTSLTPLTGLFDIQRHCVHKIGRKPRLISFTDQYLHWVFKIRNQAFTYSRQCRFFCSAATGFMICCAQLKALNGSYFSLKCAYIKPYNLFLLFSIMVFNSGSIFQLAIYINLHFSGTGSYFLVKKMVFGPCVPVYNFKAFGPIMNVILFYLSCLQEIYNVPYN